MPTTSELACSTATKTLARPSRMVIVCVMSVPHISLTLSVMIVPSLPGHWPSDAGALASLTLSDYLASLHWTAATLSAPPVVIGHSMGGLLAQQLAATAPCT